MQISRKQFGLKMPNRARNIKCPICKKGKTARDFRESNRNPKRNLICWECRRNPKTTRNFYGAKSPKKRSIFRRKILAIRGVLRAKHRQKYKKKEVNEMSVRKQATDLVKFPERVAAIVGKTYAVMGDDFKLEDDVALAMIRDKLDELDPTLIARNKKKRLS